MVKDQDQTVMNVQCNLGSGPVTCFFFFSVSGAGIFTDKILALYKLKAFAHNDYNVAQMVHFFLIYIKQKTLCCIQMQKIWIKRPCSCRNVQSPVSYVACSRFMLVCVRV